MIDVLIADDQSLIRQAVADILDSHEGITVVGEATNGQEAIEKAAVLHPDVVLMDIRMPILDGIDATAAICAQSSSTKVLILTTFEEDEYVVSALRAGASGFLGKGAELEEIIRAVEAIHAGDALLSPAATQTLITRYINSPGSLSTPNPATRAELEALTNREREVLLLVAQGKSNAEIAEELYISPHTAKTHVNRIMTKVYAHDRAQLVILAYESGLLTPGH
ncbi:response regulator [Corynebacterium pacaense]|uniref:response regulator n=1 Tax=Corynebacterium pacaense TaxID=1816684 RepID=UPI0009BA9C0B|nr:response regulator transcription factor [Corynebacterium pacaense]